MFTKTGKLKDFMKSALKSAGLCVGNIDGHIMVWDDSHWGITVAEDCASNKFKAAIMELIGDLPKEEEAYRYMVDSSGMSMHPAINIPNPMTNWRLAKDYAKQTPVFMYNFPHEYTFFQIHSNHEFVSVDRRYTEAMSASELDEGEEFPRYPNVLNESVLYYKNDRMIYWICREHLTDKVEEKFLPDLGRINFFDQNWEYPEPEEAEDDGKQEELPY